MLKFRSIRSNARGRKPGRFGPAKTTCITAFGSSPPRGQSRRGCRSYSRAIKGDASELSPRPERPVFIKQFSSSIPQLHGPPPRQSRYHQLEAPDQSDGGSTSLQTLVYRFIVLHHPLDPWLNLRILVMTVFKGLMNRNILVAGTLRVPSANLKLLKDLRFCYGTRSVPATNCS